MWSISIYHHGDSWVYGSACENPVFALCYALGGWRRVENLPDKEHPQEVRIEHVSGNIAPQVWLVQRHVTK